MKKVFLKLIGVMVIAVIIQNNFVIAASTSSLKSQQNENNKKINEAQSDLEEKKAEKSETVKEVESAMNFVCVKCPAGLANAACAAFDELHWDGVIGTLSGDDTFFVMCRNEEQAVKIAAELRKYINL